MKARLSMLNVAVALVCCAVPVCRARPVGATAIRQPGAPLDLSLRQEADHAVARAADWLAARQHADGAWGSPTGRVERTALALLALLGTDTHTDARARAALWLDSHPPTPADGAAAAAWRVLALLNAAPPDTPGRAALAARLTQESPLLLPPSPDTPCAERHLLLDALALVDGRPPATTQHPADARLLADLAADAARLRHASPSLLWPLARLINRTADGALLHHGDPLDWRRDVAQNLVNSQRRDPDQGAFWQAPDNDARIRETAFGLLTLLEL